MRGAVRPPRAMTSARGTDAIQARAADTPVLTLSGVSMSFPGRDRPVEVLRDISLVVGSSDFVCLLGPSGCGKSTILNLAAGLLTPHAGTVAYGAGSADDRAYYTAMVFQDASLFPWRTVQDNVAVGLEVKGVGKRERLQAAREVLKLVNLTGYERHYPHQLSGGMRQRVALARALACKPKVLLMDEPFGALDAQTREVMQLELLRIWSETKTAILFVTHSIDEALLLADRIAMVGDRPGRLIREFVPPFPRPRRRGLAGDPIFGSLREEIWSILETSA